MHYEARSIFKVACLYVSSILGAGFASGQEIMQFFCVYKKGGFFGILLTSLLFSLVGYLILDKVYLERIRNYDEYIFPMGGYFIGKAMQAVITVFALSAYCIMIAGGGRIFFQFFGITEIWGAALMAAICAGFLLFDIKGVVFLSTYITPVLVAGILFIGSYVILFKDISVFNAFDPLKDSINNWFFSALIYVSYNTILSSAVLSTLLPFLKSRRIAVMGGIIGGSLLGVVALIINIILGIFYPGILSSQIPILYAIEKINVNIASLYSIVLLLAMIVSAVTSGFCLAERIDWSFKTGKKIIVILASLVGIYASTFGFSELISVIYPIYGYIGMFLLFLILINKVNEKCLKY